ncbi:MAG: HAMP domain-containing sensor histidine kinase [Xanthobacteraceae bacterium]|nr:HAMP domain-containing sensor histidine kinase [Xanthobacteraceae bacterium]
MTADPAATPAPAAPGGQFRLGLSGKLLLLTILFVMIAEVLIYVPSIANFRLMWLSDRLAAAHTAALVLDAAPDGMISEALTRQLLDSVGAKAVAMKMGDKRRLLAFSKMPPKVDHEIDIRDVSALNAIVDAFETMLTVDNDIMRVVGPAPMGAEFVEIIIDERPLRAAMLRFSQNILLISLAISAITGMLVYTSLLWLIVRPMRRLTACMVAFGQAPEDPARIVAPSSRSDEIGVAERELSVMQRELAGTLQQKNRLASLGLAVSKINHDLRNLLSSAQLLSDRLAGLADPAVRRLAPKLMATLGRAIAYCEQTLAYGRAQEPPPERRHVDVARLLDEVRDTLDLGPAAAIGWVPSIERELTVDADPDQLSRALINLVKNSIEAFANRAPNDPERDQIRIVGRREGAVVVLQVSDTGPGLTERARAHLFEPFQGSGRRGGTGLGLAIAAELVRAHGGEIQLLHGTIGAAFRIVIPDRPVALDQHRAERARA